MWAILMIMFTDSCESATGHSVSLAQTPTVTMTTAAASTLHSAPDDQLKSIEEMHVKLTQQQHDIEIMVDTMVLRAQERDSDRHDHGE